MKKLISILLAVVCLMVSLLVVRAFGQDKEVVAPQTYEYATIRWSGRENTHWVLPGGIVEFLGSELSRKKRPDRADERSFCMNLAMNAMAKKGWVFAGMTNDEIVMQRPVPH